MRDVRVLTNSLGIHRCLVLVARRSTPGSAHWPTPASRVTGIRRSAAAIAGHKSPRRDPALGPYIPSAASSKANPCCARRPASIDNPRSANLNSELTVGVPRTTGHRRRGAGEQPTAGEATSTGVIERSTNSCSVPLYSEALSADHPGSSFCWRCQSQTFSTSLL